MAVGVVQYQNESIKQAINSAKVVYAVHRRILDALIEIKNSGGGNNWQAVADAVGASGTTNGQTVFDNLDASIAGLTTCYNALSKMDSGAL